MLNSNSWPRRGLNMGKCCREVMLREMRGGAPAGDPKGGVNCVTMKGLIPTIQPPTHLPCFW
jgi:hypothetical protein